MIWNEDLRRHLRAVLTVLLFLGAQAARGDVAEVGYGFARDGGGGVVVVAVDTAAGKILDQRILFESAECTNPEKLRRSVARKQLLLTSETSRASGPHLFLIDDNGEPRVRSLALPEMPDEVRVAGDFAVATCEDDWMVQVNLDSAAVVGKWNAEDILDPPGNGPEDLCFTADGPYVAVSFQKDSGSGKKRGSRIGIFRLPEFDVVADAQLPRNKPELHNANNNKETGPGPEVIHISEQNNTIVVTLDLYGAVAVADWKPLLAGKPVTWSYLSTATDGSWGTAFPDRMGVFQLDGREVALVTNAGEAGGVALLDVKAREIIWRQKTPAGLETPVYIPAVRKAYAVCSGKTKQRRLKETEKTFHPRSGVYVCDFSSAESSPAAWREREVTTIETERILYRITDVEEGTPWLLVAGGEGSADTLMILDARSGRFVDEQPTIGALSRFEGG
jgi:hypothetical protein